MMRSKRGLAVLGLCAVALGVVVFGPSAVQAEKGANWMVKGSNVTAELLPEVAMTEIVTKHMTLLTKVGGASLELLCSNAQFINARLETEGRVGGGNKVKFTGCVTKLNGTTSSACVPHTGAEPAGTLLSNALKGLLVLFEGKSIIKFEPVSGTVFLPVVLGEGECGVAENCAINGVSSVIDVKEEMGKELVTHTVKQLASASELWVISKTAEHMATVDGEGALKLAGTHSGLNWSGLPA